tara:strand:- start:172 stop:375 length:204 start_codon:yes stop_codon:yes gene_type:complete
MSKITILNNNTIMKNGVVFTVPGQEPGPAKVLPNGKTVFTENPSSVEDVIDNMKETKLENLLWGENE